MDHDDECVWLRLGVLLDPGDGPMIEVQTRKLCRMGIFLEYSGEVAFESVNIIFPDPYARAGKCRLPGVVTRRYPDGVWIRFRHELRSATEMLMRQGPPLGARSHQQPSLNPSHYL